MIVTVIRHAKVDMKWDLMMTSAGYDKGCADYDTAGVLPVTVRLPETEFERIYVSALPRTTATARQVFADREFESTALINEVPERSVVSYQQDPVVLQCAAPTGNAGADKTSRQKSCAVSESKE